MRSILTRISWQIWEQCCKKNILTFVQALKDPDASQERHFNRIIINASNTIWGNAFGIKKGMSIDSFRERVPIQTPSELKTWTNHILNGDRNVLTQEPVVRLVPTSGTTFEPKLIPMTASSQTEFNIAINIWLGNILAHFPAIKNGKAYIATSPAIDVKANSKHVPVGFASDQSYLGHLERIIIQQLLAVPLNVSALRGESWIQATRQFLQTSKNLTFLSLWHPGYLEALFTPSELDGISKQWPHLKLISAWSDGACHSAAENLISIFPQATLAPKGLWLTEGIISIPFEGRCPLALESAFLEFENTKGELFLASELKKETLYRPILSNHAGLYRYRTGDYIEVIDFAEKTPCIRWVGRADYTSDICGEKLSDAQAALAISSCKIKDQAILRPILQGYPPYYELLTTDPSDPECLADNMDLMLRKNAHYDWARAVGQLAKIVVKKTNRDTLIKLQGNKTKHIKAASLAPPSSAIGRGGRT